MKGLVLAVGAAVLLAMPAGVEASPVVAHFPDRVIEGGPARAASAPLARTRSYRTPDGQHVEVAVSASYPDDPSSDRALVDFLATREHGRELGSISLFVGKPAEVNRLCGGGDVIACYATAEQRMYVPGEDAAGISSEYAITHEYGHHIAASRRNDPWDALDWGPKYWSSAVGVCAAVKRHELWPGDQGRHYLSDPGEGFADGYAHLHYPDEPWHYDSLMRPDSRILEAIRRDVEEPWTGPRTRVVNGRARLRVTLDGEVTVRVAGSPRSRFALTVRTGAWREQRVVRGGAEIGTDVCRPAWADAQGLTVDVRRLDGGPARATVRYPG